MDTPVRPIVAAVADGELPGLVSIRDRLAAELEVCESSRDTVALARQLAECMRRIGELQAETAPKRSAADEIAERRARRAAG